MNNRKLYTALAFAGATPFLACALFPLVGIYAIEPFGRFNLLAGSYGLAIICFLAGTHWAVYLLKQAEIRINLFIGSNAVLLAVWFVFVTASVTWTLVSQLAAFVLLLLIDYHLLRIAVISSGYFRVRAIATSLAAVSLLVILMTP